MNKETFDEAVKAVLNKHVDGLKGVKPAMVMFIGLTMAMGFAELSAEIFGKENENEA